MVRSILPTAVTLPLLAAMVASTVRAFFGEPPKRQWLAVAPLALAAAILILAAGVVGGYYRVADVAALLAAGGTGFACAAGWIARFDDRRDGGPDEDDLEPPPIPFDWEEFERQMRERADAPSLETAGRGDLARVP